MIYSLKQCQVLCNKLNSNKDLQYVIINLGNDRGRIDAYADDVLIVEGYIAQQSPLMKRIYVYKLTDVNGRDMSCVVNDLSDNLCIYGIGSDGNHHQFDSCEVYNAFDWAESHGMVLELGTIDIDLNSISFE